MGYLLVFVLALGVACDKRPGDIGPRVDDSGKVSQPAAPTAMPSAPAGMPAAGPDKITGQVLEVLDVTSYTYLRLKTDSGEEWAAVSKAPVQKGAKVTLLGPALMRNFRSESLNKTFDRIYFGALMTAGGESTAAGAQAAGAPTLGGATVPHPGGMAPAADVGEIKVAKAQGDRGRTVAEVYAQSAELAGKDVAVRGKVVKFSANIMGSNWVHIRDGSGAVADNNNDLTVTTPDIVAVGDEVLVRGTVARNKEFGSGYSYAVIVEQATVKK